MLRAWARRGIWEVQAGRRPSGRHQPRRPTLSHTRAKTRAANPPWLASASRGACHCGWGRWQTQLRPGGSRGRLCRGSATCLACSAFVATLAHESCQPPLALETTHRWVRTNLAVAWNSDATASRRCPSAAWQSRGIAPTCRLPELELRSAAKSRWWCGQRRGDQSFA